MASVMGCGLVSSVFPGLLVDSGPGEWMVFPVEASTRAHRIVPLVTRYRTGLVRPPADGTLSIEGETLGRATVRLNGQPLPVEIVSERALVHGDVRQRFHVSIDGARAGADAGSQLELRVDVERRAGPAVLSIRVDGATAAAGDPEWWVSRAGSEWRKAVPPRPLLRPDPGLVDRRDRDPWHVLPRHAPGLLLAAAAGALLFGGLVLARRRIGDGQAPVRQNLFLAVTMLCAFGWLALFGHDAPFLPPKVGFDVEHHLAYVDFLREEGRLPRADEGYQFYQPPLYYGLAALSLAGSDAKADAPASLARLRLLGTAIALGYLAALAGVIRSLRLRSLAAEIAALVFVAALPMHLYLFQLPTNEGLSAALSALVAWLALRLEPAERSGGEDAAAPWRAWVTPAGIGLALGLALLAKVSALVLVPFVGWLLFFRRGAGAIGVAAAAFVAVCGPWYAIVYSQSGTLFPTNWGADSPFAIWQDPGLRTASDFVRLADVLADPWYASLRSLPAGLFSTAFGDGLGSGLSILRGGAPWSFERMSAGYALAVLPALLLVAGLGVGAVRLAARPLSPTRCALPGLLLTMGVAFVWIVVSAPYYSFVKAFYWLPAAAAWVAVFGLAFDAAVARSRGLAIVVAAGLAAWAFTAGATFWIDPASKSAAWAESVALLEAGRLQEGFDAVATLAERDADWLEAQVYACEVLARSGRPERATAACDRAMALAPDDPGVATIALRRAAANGEARGLLVERLFALHEHHPDDKALGELAQRTVIEIRDLDAFETVTARRLAANPWLVEERVSLVRVRALAGRFDAAEEAMGDLALLAPSHAALPSLEALIEEKRREARTIFEDAERALRDEGGGLLPEDG